MINDEGLQFRQLEGGVEILGHGTDDLADGGADGSVVVAAEPLPVVPDPVPGDVSSDDVPTDTDDHSPSVLLPHTRLLVEGHLQVPLQDPHLSGAGQGVHDGDLLIPIVGVLVPRPQEVPGGLIPVSDGGAQDGVPDGGGDGVLGVGVGDGHPLVDQVGAVLVALHVIQSADDLKHQDP